ncbi:hypothetical protein Plhal304r1_c022g0076421 [Plasmopara halstedii]
MSPRRKKPGVFIEVGYHFSCSLTQFAEWKSTTLYLTTLTFMTRSFKATSRIH